MRFGLNFFPAFRSSELSAADYFAQTLRICERGDELGFDSVKTVEHYFHEYGGYSTNPSILLAAIVARTKRMRPINRGVFEYRRRGYARDPLREQDDYAQPGSGQRCTHCGIWYARRAY